jgi:hypothetical protein
MEEKSILNRNSERQFCQPIVSGGAIFSVSDLKKATKLTMFEKICLWFVSPKYQVDEFKNSTLKYKTFRGKMYVLAIWINPPKHWNCRCEFVTKYHR